LGREELIFFHLFPSVVSKNFQPLQIAAVIATDLLDRIASELFQKSLRCFEGDR
jgi:hypothetical protein